MGRLPFSVRVLVENLLRHSTVTPVPDAAPRAGSPQPGGGGGSETVAALARGERGFEIPFYPARVLLQDLLGVPVMVDFAALREAIAAAGGDPQTINPQIPVDFVVDHSIIADVAGSADAAQRNVEIEYARNRERFAFLAWCQGAFQNFRVVPPDSGIVHQINVERLARVVWTSDAGTVSGDSRPSPAAKCPAEQRSGEAGSNVPLLAFPDTMVCNDSHSTMVNGIGVLGWGVGGIEAEAAMLGRALMMRVPEVLGVRVTGELPAGATATDLVLTITEQFRKTGVVGKFVELYGSRVDALEKRHQLCSGDGR